MNKKITTLLLSTLLTFSSISYAENTVDNKEMNSIMQTILLENFLNTYNKSVNKDFNIVNLYLEENQSVIENYLEVTLKVYEEGENREEVQKKLLSKYNAGTEKVKILLIKKDSDSFEVKNTYFRVFPQETYNQKDGTLEKTIWKGEGTIVLGGTDIDKVSNIATNINNFTIYSSKMMVSEMLKNKTTKELQSKMITSFKERAKLLSEELGFDGKFTIKELNVNYQNFSAAPQARKANMMVESSMSFDMQNESISTIPSQVNISGHINGSIILGDLSSNSIKIEQ